jgi:hypothetical protein
MDEIHHTRLVVEALRRRSSTHSGLLANLGITAQSETCTFQTIEFFQVTLVYGMCVPVVSFALIQAYNMYIHSLIDKRNPIAYPYPLSRSVSLSQGTITNHEN